jgi:hypothetical protein
LRAHVERLFDPAHHALHAQRIQLVLVGLSERAMPAVAPASEGENGFDPTAVEQGRGEIARGASFFVFTRDDVVSQRLRLRMLFVELLRVGNPTNISFCPTRYALRHCNPPRGPSELDAAVHGEASSDKRGALGSFGTVIVFGVADEIERDLALQDRNHRAQHPLRGDAGRACVKHFHRRLRRCHGIRQAHSEKRGAIKQTSDC